MEELLKTVAQGLVENPEQVQVTVVLPTTEIPITVYHLHVASSDKGRVIGKQGKIANAIRVIMRSASAKSESKIAVEID